MIKTLYALILVGLSLAGYAQDTLYIFKAGNLVFKTSMTSVDSMGFKPITFDSLFVYKTGVVSYSTGLASIDSITFTQPKLSQGILTDLEGNLYPTVTIGTQTWMAENLRATKYNDGTAIYLEKSAANWQDNFNNYTRKPMMCWYNNDQATSASKYGAIYNWYAVNTKKLCPKGWHVPSDDEWTTLADYLDKSTAGIQMKSTTGWDNAGNGTNSSAFNGVPASNRSTNGQYQYTVGKFAEWWSSTPYNVYYAWSWGISYDVNSVNHYGVWQENGFSVRCIKD
jgi:uncharacterized protein (TIGR02145 family)